MVPVFCRFYIIKSSVFSVALEGVFQTVHGQVGICLGCCEVFKARVVERSDLLAFCDD